MPGREDLCAPDGQTVQANAARILRSGSRQHEAVVLRPGDDQDRRAGGDEVHQQGALHLQRHRGRLLCHRREGPAEGPDWFPQSQQYGLRVLAEPHQFWRLQDQKEILRVLDFTQPGEVKKKVIRQNESRQDLSKSGSHESFGETKSRQKPVWFISKQH